MKHVRAIIADDEKALRDYLRKKLLLLWPELSVAGEAADGEAALGLIRGERPDVAFLDISMPGLSGLEVAQRAPGQCLFVFITAHDKYAINAFENDAVDYLLKPVTDERLGKTVKRLKERLAASPAAPDISAVLEKVSRSLRQAPAYLQWIKAQHKDGVRLIPVADIYYLKAADKYTTIRTREAEFLIRKTITELEQELDPELFWRVHRAALVNVKTVHTVKRSVAGTCSIRFRDIPDNLAVSRAYAHLFKQM
jgi:DNA-binding LytR/AlgR family response regulator